MTHKGNPGNYSACNPARRPRMTCHMLLRSFERKVALCAQLSVSQANVSILSAWKVDRPANSGYDMGVYHSHRARSKHTVAIDKLGWEAYNDNLTHNVNGIKFAR
jgi:hypothetical protein